MNDYTSIRHQFCPNKLCIFYEKKLSGNVTLHSQTVGRMQCKTCKKTWVAHRNEIRYGLRSDPEKIQSAITMIGNGMSIRKTAAALHLSQSTIQRLRKRIKNNFNS